MWERALVQSKKIIIMASRPQPPMPEGVPPESHAPGFESQGTAFGPGPYSAGEIRILNLLLEIKEKLGGTGQLTRILENASNTHDERLLEVIRQAERTASVLPSLQETVARHDRDLNGLGRVAHSARLLGNIALSVLAGGGILLAILAYLYHLLVK
jgi:hypothetical protein